MTIKSNIALYILTAALLAVSVYLKSPVIAVSIVALWAVHASETVFTRKNRDADIAEMMATLASHKAQMSILTQDITNVSKRAQVILGENF
jgi:hypothetical protein